MSLNDEDAPQQTGAANANTTITPVIPPTTSGPTNPNPQFPSLPPGTDINALCNLLLLSTLQNFNLGTATPQTATPSAPVQSQTLASQWVGPAALNPAAGESANSIDSLCDLFPEIEDGVLRLVATHQLPAGDLYKLDDRYTNRPARSALELDGNTLKIKGDVGTKDYPTYSYVHQPLSTYFIILLRSVPDKYVKIVGTATVRYLAQLQKLNDEYEWPAVLRYHMAFFQRRRREMLRGDYGHWGVRDGELFDEHLAGHRRQKASAPTPSGTALSPRKNTSAEVCRLFNAGTCNTPCKFGRIHRCNVNGCTSEAHGASTHKGQ